jgi:hypothetical protein
MTEELDFGTIYVRSILLFAAHGRLPSFGRCCVFAFSIVTAGNGLNMAELSKNKWSWQNQSRK